MKIIIKGDSQDVDYTMLATYLHNFNEERMIDIDINGLEFKGFITTIVYRQTGMAGTYRVIEIEAETE